MPENPEAQQIQQENNEKLRILQINLNKSAKAHIEIMNERVSQKYDIILIQEPHFTSFNKIRTPTNFRSIFPINRIGNEQMVRSVVLVNSKLNTNNWNPINIPGTNDITAIQLKGPYGEISIFNIYNDCAHNENEIFLQNYMQEHANELLASENHHMIWAGDFNRHHPL